MKLRDRSNLKSTAWYYDYSEVVAHNFGAATTTVSTSSRRSERLAEKRSSAKRKQLSSRLSEILPKRNKTQARSVTPIPASHDSACASSDQPRAPTRSGLRPVVPKKPIYSPLQDRTRAPAQRRKNGVERALFVEEASSGTVVSSGQAVNGKAATTGNPFDDLKARLHASAIPKNLPCREQQFEKIKLFISCCLKAEIGGCIYISGVPGTGKTVTIRHAVHSLLSDKKIPKFSYCEVLDPKCVYLEMVRAMKKAWKFKSTDNARKVLDQTFSKVDRNRLPMVLLMDEVDLLISSRQRVLYQLFDWSTQEEAKLIVLAVANTLDFPERVLSKRISSRVRLQSN
ncbi:hypothetical protein D918_03648 [Trichuris suis]|nr:hypothetical protein D918_03648 [Trichuris suis]